jgi:hypothetical protein
MSRQQMVSETIGIGQLVNQRRYFQVPLHQRDYAWPIGAVEQFANDICEAMERNDSEYFIGLIVLVDKDFTNSKRYEILDGQQRLATSTMIFAAIRHWLKNNGFDNDAQKIQSDFIGISEIGQDQDEPRLILNLNNRELFQEIVVNQCSDATIEKRLKDTGKYTSTRMLVEAASWCRKFVSKLAEGQGDDKKKQAQVLFNLAKYSRDNVQANCLDVAEPDNAYMIFESLNDRGIALSVLDLLKNHIFMIAGDFKQEIIQHNWTKMVSHLGDRRADDFIKAFWTSRNGRTQRGRLFHDLKRKYKTPEEVLSLSDELANLSEKYSNLDIADSELWKQYSLSCQESIKSLSLLGSLQTRPILLSALDKFTPSEIERLLHNLVALIVRYQMVGRGRTGRLEIAAAGIASGIYNGKLKSPHVVWEELKAIIPNDADFYQDFLRYSETKAPPARYMLRELEILRWKEVNPGKSIQQIPITDPNLVNLEHILPKNPDQSWKNILHNDLDILNDCVDKLGNLCLLDKPSNKNFATVDFQTKSSKIYSQSELLLTKELSERYSKWDRQSIEDRQKTLAELAIKAWPL